MAEENQNKSALEKLATHNDEALLQRPLMAPARPVSNDDYGYGRYDESEGGLHVRDIWRIMRKRKWLILPLAALITLLVTIEVHRTPSVYEAENKIKASKEGGGAVISTKDFTVQADDQDSMQTMIVELTSRPLLESVVESLKLDQRPDFLDATRKRTVTEALQDIAHRFTGGTFGASVNSTEPNIKKAPTVERSAEESERLAPYVNALKGRLAATVVKDTRIIELSFTHNDPRLAADVVNAVAKNYIDQSHTRKLETFTDTSEWLTKSTNELRARMQQAEQKLADYTRNNGIFQSDGKTDITVNKLADMYAQTMKAETERMLKESVYEQVKQGRIAELPDTFADQNSSKLKEELNRLEVQDAELSVKFGTENPRVAEVREKIKILKDQIASTRSTLENKLKADYERAVRDERSLKAALETAKSDAVQQNQAGITFNILKEEVETSKRLYADFLNKMQQTNLQKVEQQKNMRIIEPAEVPGSPIGPKRMRTILLGLLVSLVFGIGLAFFLEYLDNTVKSVDDIQRFAQLPTLAIIPSIDAASQRAVKKANRRALTSGNETPNLANALVLRDDPDDQRTAVLPAEHLTSVVEAYRMLRTSVLLSTAGSPPKTILFTSGQPGDGKTTTAVNTGVSLAQLGSKVLLIDCDLRRPTLHRALRIAKQPGLSAYLSSDAKPEDVILSTRVPNLSAITCGPVPPNPAELLASDRMRELLAWASQHYEHVILDSPPLLSVTDPVVLSTRVDGVILVVQAGRSTRDILRRARQELTHVGAKVFGVVLNNLDMRREGYGPNDASYYAAGSYHREHARRHG
ncbi:MAG: polysaccharide biosynthesis tyrosine autokinase [Acidobacteria bacterium]|nr:polysaccharide biosynthesis tyrosine autokinase [Acidobacteriota bacterium]